MKWEAIREAFIKVMFVVCFFILAYCIGRQDYTNELACTRSVVQHHKDDAEFFYQKWREQESVSFKLQIKLDQAGIK